MTKVGLYQDGGAWGRKEEREVLSTNLFTFTKLRPRSARVLWIGSQRIPCPGFHPGGEDKRK